MKLIADWPNKGYRCTKCATTKSVKYEGKNGNTYCNVCITLVNTEFTTEQVYEFIKQYKDYYNEIDEIMLHPDRVEARCGVHINRPGDEYSYYISYKEIRGKD